MVETLMDDQLQLDPNEIANRQRSVGKIIGPPANAPHQAAITPIGKPLAPPSVTPGPDTGSHFPPQMMENPPAGGLVGTPPEMPAPQAPTSIGTPIGTGEPMQPKPDVHSTDPNERFQALQAQGPPQEHGLRRLADTIAGATGIGTNIEEAAGIGTQGYYSKLNDAKQASEAENKQTAQGQEEKQRQATLEGTEATTAQKEDVTVTLPNGQTVTVPKGKEADVLKTGMTQQGETERANAKLGIGPDGKPIPEEQLPPAQREQIVLARSREKLADAEAEYAKFRSDPKSPMYNIAQQRLKLATDEYFLRQKEFGYNYEPSALSPEEQGNLPTDAAGNPVGLHNPLKPGGQLVNAAYRAQQAQQQLPRIRQEVQQVAGEIGPAAGRWNALFTGQGGFTDEQYTKIHADQEFLSSALALMHAYGRMPNNILNKFDKLYADSAQSPENFLAALDIAEEWIPQIAAAGKTVGEKGGQGNQGGGQGGAGASSAPPPGAKIRDYSQLGGAK